MFIREDDLKLNEWQFSQRKYLPWEMKLKLSRTRIQEWYDNWDGQVYLSYSGGLDSRVLLDLIRKTVGDDVPAVFSNTGLEYPEIVKFARRASGEYREIEPRNKAGKRISFRDVILTEGYPVVSKETAMKIRKLRHGNLSEKYRNYLLNGDERGKFGMLPKKWQFLITERIEMLNRMRIKRVHLAWDKPDQDLTEDFKRFSECYSRKSESGKVVYVLTNFDSTIEQDLHRIYTLRDLRFDPYVMIYDKEHAAPIYRDMQRWVNNRIIWRSCKRFEDYVA